MTLPVLLFDLDGTLTDPRPGIVGSIRHALDRLGKPCPPDDVLATFIGPPLRGTFGRLLESSERTVIEGAMALYRERFASVGLYENQVYDGIPEVLDALARTSRAFVATAKPAVFAARILEHFELDRHFAGVYGPDLDGRLDDKADLLAHLLSREGIAPGAAIMIGDRAGDVIAARTNGIRALGVLWGYGSAQELLDAGAAALCLAPRELATCLARMGP